MICEFKLPGGQYGHWIYEDQLICILDITTWGYFEFLSATIFDKHYFHECETTHQRLEFCAIIFQKKTLLILF